MNWNWMKDPLAGIFIPIGGAALAWFLVWLTWDWVPSSNNQWGTHDRLCDQFVDALLHSKDPIELQRAGILVPYLDCGVSRRAAKDEQPTVIQSPGLTITIQPGKP